MTNSHSLNAAGQPVITASITPRSTLTLLSHKEVERLQDHSQNSVYDLFRLCALAVLNCGSHVDACHRLTEAFPDFDIAVESAERGFTLRLVNAPAAAFVDGKLIAGIREHLFAVVRDIVYLHCELPHASEALPTDAAEITNLVFHILRHAEVLKAGDDTGIAVCWGGHSISRQEYEYSKDVGHQLGLRDINICTGCGPGIMKGPMKGAALGHAKQRLGTGRYIGVSEPGIIAAEAPNPIVNELVILPDIEKRLEAFVRLGHAFIIFPGGVGTVEELLFLLGVLLDPANKDLPFPLILTAPQTSAEYMQRLDAFIGETLGAEAQSRYKMIIGDAEAVARAVSRGCDEVFEYRRKTDDAYYFNWGLTIDASLSARFEPSHENMAAETLSRERPVHELTNSLRRVFSGIVAGNVKEYGVEQIEKHGPYQLRGDNEIMQRLDALLTQFVEEQRMQLPGSTYTPCYEIQ